MYSRNPQMERLGNRLIRSPLRCPQQHMGTHNLAGRRLAFMDHVQQVSPLLFGEINQIFVSHGDSSC